jgi:hypothetical protein
MTESSGRQLQQLRWQALSKRWHHGAASVTHNV